jgi:hypothetical protein
VSDGLEQCRSDLEGRGVAVSRVTGSERHRFFRFRDLDGNVIEVTEPRT